MNKLQLAHEAQIMKLREHYESRIQSNTQQQQQQQQQQQHHGNNGNATATTTTADNKINNNPKANENTGPSGRTYTEL